MSKPGHENCPCVNCSQGFCHYCAVPTTAKLPRLDGEGYAYLAGCKKAQVSHKGVGKTQVAIDGSVCQHCIASPYF